MKKYSIGIDYGTLSGRALLAEVDTGKEVAEAVYEYPHGVADRYIPDTDIPLGEDFALQHPNDYLEVLYHAIPEVIKKAGISADDVIGVGIDFTACTMLPVYKDGTPLCVDEKFAENPHSYVKLWKHHAAQPYASKINETAKVRGEEWITKYGGFIDSEWFFPKLFETLKEAPEVYAAADFFIEAGDFIVWQLTGKQTRSYPFAAYKAIYDKRNGFPSKEFFGAIDKRAENVIEEKMTTEYSDIGTRAGKLTAEMAKKTGLKEGTPIGTAFLDAHASAISLGAIKDGYMMAVMGTSMPILLVSSQNERVPGICGVVEDGIIPGYYGYEAGLCCMGDHFAWFTENCVPSSYKEAADKEGKSVIEYITEKADKLKAGESGIIALDWWNGNRSTLIDAELNGIFIGMTLSAKPEELYRALVEATAFGTKMIIENYRRHGVKVTEFVAVGGISRKSPFLMQIYSDVLGMEIKTVKSKQIPALGSAILGAIAAGNAGGGYDTIEEASEKMKSPIDRIYRPNAENTKIYEKLFAEYEKLYDYFGRGENNVMKKLRAIKAEAKKNI